MKNVLFYSEITETESTTVLRPHTENEECKTASTSRDTWAAVLTDSDEQSQDEEAAEASFSSEINSYLKEKRVTDLKMDPIDYWKVKKINFPHLARLARRYLTTPPGSATSERVFKTGKNVLGSTRIRLKPRNMEALLFLKYNIRALGYRTDLPKVQADWVAPNDTILPDPTDGDADALDPDDDAEIQILSDSESEDEG